MTGKSCSSSASEASKGKLTGKIQKLDEKLTGKIDEQGRELRGELAEVRGSVSTLKLELLGCSIAILATIIGKPLIF